MGYGKKGEETQVNQRLSAQIEWTQVYKGPHKQGLKLKQYYKERGYYTRLRNRTSYYTLEVGEPKLYKLDRRNDG